MSNVLNEEKKQQVIALGRLGWSLRRIERRTGVRRETAATYLKAAGELDERRQIAHGLVGSARGVGAFSVAYIASEAEFEFRI